MTIRTTGINLAALTGAKGKRGKKVKVSEKDFQTTVIGLARVYGFRVAHFRKVRVQRKDKSVYWETPVAADGKGFPDLVLAKPGRVIFAELKAGKNTTSIEQRIWIDTLKLGGVDVFEWRPEQMDEIERELSREAE